MQKRRTLDFSLIQKGWETLLAAMELKIEREFPAEHEASGARVVLYFTFKVARNAYKTVLYICADKPKDPFRLLSYSVSCPPIVRSLVDSLFTIVFILEDLDVRASWYHKSGWREHEERYFRYKEMYGSDPEWSQYLDELRRAQEAGKKIWGISTAEASNPKSIPYWPIPSQMIPAAKTPPTRDFFRYLQDWFYRELSQESHLSSPGLATRGSLLEAAEKNMPDSEEHLQHCKSVQATMAFVLMVAICSELEQHFNFGLRDRLLVMWRMSEELPIPNEIWQKRYREMFA
jgi:hypothetical protein